MKRHVSTSITATAISILGVFALLPAFGGDGDFKLDYDAPDYKNTQIPSITSCDPKNPASAYTTSGGSAAADIMNTAVKSALSVKDSLQGDDDEGEDGIDGKATIDTECGEPASIAMESTKDLACKLVTDDFIEGKKEEVAKATSVMACQRGVLTAMGGEVACLKKQIGEAEKAIDAIVNSPGGLASMLKTGQDTFQDRTGQLKTVGERIKGTGPGSPGLEGAAKLLQDLGASIPVQVDAANTQVTAIREDQARFESLIKQVETAQIMKCMNTPVETNLCVKKGSSSKNYPVGAVSPIALYQCLYAQSANKIVGGKVILNEKREKALYESSKAALTYRGDDEIRASADFPSYSDTEAFRKSFRTYDVNTPEQLLASLKSKVSSMSIPGKNLGAQVDLDFKRCQAAAAARTVSDRASSSSSIRSSQKAMERDISKQKAANAKAFRELRNQYSSALKAATGKSILPDTQGCEKASIEEQAKCFDALNSMVDTLYTGKTRTTDSTLGAAALGLTGGANPIRAFLGSVEATNDKTRTIRVDCAGVDDCLTKYTSLESGLKSFVESYPTNLNNTLQSTATNIANGNDPRTGQPSMGAANLRAVTDGIAAVKAKLMGALSKMNVDDGLDLDPRKTDAPEKDEKSGLYQQNGLKNLVLMGLSPGLPDASSKGFGETLKAINKRKTEVKDEQAKLATFITELESRKAACVGEVKKAAKEEVQNVCDRLDKVLERCDATKKVDALEQRVQDWMYTQNKLPSAARPTNPLTGNVSPATNLNCGVAQQEFDKHCLFGDAVSDRLDKNSDEIRGKKKTTGKNSGEGN